MKPNATRQAPRKKRARTGQVPRKAVAAIAKVGTIYGDLAREGAAGPPEDEPRKEQARQAGALLGPSVVRLFGMVLDNGEAAAAAAVFAPTVAGRARRNMLLPDEQDAPLRLARIYGFSHEGRYNPLQPPALFVVHGPGAPAPEAHEPGALAILGFAQQIDLFTRGVRAWAYDRSEVTSRIDHTSGTLQELLGAPPAVAAGPAPRRSDILSGQDGSLFGRAGRFAV